MNLEEGVINFVHTKSNNPRSVPLSSEAKKMIPLLLVKNSYNHHKEINEDGINFTFHLVIDEAHNISLNCRHIIENTPIPTDLGDIYLTISGGLVEIDEHTLDVLPLIKKADKALYQAKDKGRNQIVVL